MMEPPTRMALEDLAESAYPKPDFSGKMCGAEGVPKAGGKLMILIPNSTTGPRYDPPGWDLRRRRPEVSARACASSLAVRDPQASARALLDVRCRQAEERDPLRAAAQCR